MINRKKRHYGAKIAITLCLKLGRNMRKVGGYENLMKIRIRNVLSLQTKLFKDNI